MGLIARPLYRDGWFCLACLAAAGLLCLVILTSSHHAIVWANGIAAFLAVSLVTGYSALLIREAVQKRTSLTVAFLRLVALGAIAAVVMTRGAPHNNALLYGVFESYGAASLLSLAIMLCLFGVAIVLYALKDVDSDAVELALRRAWPVILLCLAVVAALGAAQAIAGAWDQPSWGDASGYDRFAHLIALGQLPAGESGYMPIYQFGSGFLYWTFGHFFFVQQLANLLLAPATVLLIAMAASRLFGSYSAGALAGLLAASHDSLRFTPHMMTIENWYLPAIALILFCAVRYLRSPSIGMAVLVALAAGLAFNIRLQGAFFFAFVLLVPFFVMHLDMRRRAVHVAAAALVFAMAITPWTIRNFVVDGQLSPGTPKQSVAQMIRTGDKRVFYGIRRGSAETRAIIEEWVARYPDDAERHRAQAIYGWLRPIQDPKFVWLEAVPWRLLAYYGLLPPGVWEPDGARSTDWAHHGKEYVLRVAPMVMILLATAIGLLFVRPWRHGLFLLGCIGANLVIVLWAGFSEPRVAYPLLPLHMLIAVAPFAVAKQQTIQNGSRQVPRISQPLVAFCLFGGIVVVALLSRSVWGAPNALRPLTQEIKVSKNVQADDTLTDISCIDIAHMLPDGKLVPRETRPAIRIRAIVTNNHWPVKYYGRASTDVGGALHGFPEFTTDPDGDTYYFARGDRSGCEARVNGVSKRFLGLAMARALSDQKIREGDRVELLGRVAARQSSHAFESLWIDVSSIRLLERSGRRDY